MFTWIKPCPVCSKVLSIYLSIHLSVLFTMTSVLFQVVQKEDKVTAAGQNVQDVDRQHSETDLRSVIKDYTFDKNKYSFKQAQSKQDPDSRRTSKQQVSLLARATDWSAAWRHAEDRHETSLGSISPLCSHAGSP